MVPQLCTEPLQSNSLWRVNWYQLVVAQGNTHFHYALVKSNEQYLRELTLVNNCRQDTWLAAILHPIPACYSKSEQHSRLCSR